MTTRFVYPVLGVEVEKYIDNTSTQLLKSGTSSIWRLASAKLQTSENQSNEIWQSATAKLQGFVTEMEKKLDLTISDDKMTTYKALRHIQMSEASKFVQRFPLPKRTDLLPKEQEVLIITTQKEEKDYPKG